MEPEEFISKYECALRTQDWNEVAPLIHANACVTFSNGAQHIGKAEVQKAFETNFSTIKSEEYSIQYVRWILKSESIAIYLFEYFWKGIIDDRLVEGNGVGTSVLTKEKESWLLLTENLSKKVS